MGDPGRRDRRDRRGCDRMAGTGRRRASGSSSRAGSCSPSPPRCRSSRVRAPARATGSSGWRVYPPRRAGGGRGPARERARSGPLRRDPSLRDRARGRGPLAEGVRRPYRWSRMVPRRGRRRAHVVLGVDGSLLERGDRRVRDRRSAHAGLSDSIAAPASADPSRARTDRAARDPRAQRRQAPGIGFQERRRHLTRRPEAHDFSCSALTTACPW